MGYYTRVLTKSSRPIPLADVARFVPKDALAVPPGTNEPWTEAELWNAAQSPVAQISRDVVEPGSMASEEIDEFIDEIRDTGAEREPARWLVDYLRDVKVIYAFQHLAFDDEAFMLIDAVRGGVHSVVGGIVQADGEGFSDESGKLILETP